MSAPSQSSASSKKRAATFLGVALSAGILIYLLANLDLNEFWKVLSGARVGFLLPLIFLLLLVNYFRALRWSYLLAADSAFSVRNLFEAITVGFTATFLLPLRAGEFVRALYITKLEPVSFAAAFASIVAERVFDILALLVIFGLCVGMLPNVPPLLAIGAKSLAVIAAGGVLFIAVAYRFPRTILHWVVSCCALSSLAPTSRLTRRLTGLASEFLKGLQCVSSINRLALIVIYTGLIWGSVCCFYWLSLPALQAGGSFFAGAIVTVVIAFAVAAPSAPGFIGTYQAGCVIALSTILAFSEPFAIAYSVFTHLLQAVLIIALGLLFLARRGMTIGQLKYGASSAGNNG